MKSILCLIFLYASFVTILARDNCMGQKNCDVGNKNYERFESLVTYEKAKHRCSEWGKYQGSVGRLATIQNNQEMKAIKMLVLSQTKRFTRLLTMNYGYGFFIGAEYSAEHEIWNWNKKSTLEYSYWKNNLTPSNQNQKCAIVSPSELSRWKSVACNRIMFYICERDLISNSSSCDTIEETPIDFDPFDPSITICGSHETERYIRGWKGKHYSKWNIRNTGKGITITPFPVMSTWMTFRNSLKKYFVSYMILKWGSIFNHGSQHSVRGNQVAGELQVYLRDINGNLSHVLVFLIEERTAFDNSQWDELLEHAIRCRNVNQTSSCNAPRNGIRVLLMDSLPSRSSLNFPRYIESASFRYHRSLPCSDRVTWTIFPRPINLSSSQFRQLNGIHKDQTSASTKNIWSNTESSPSICTISA